VRAETKAVRIQSYIIDISEEETVHDDDTMNIEVAIFKCLIIYKLQK